MFSVGNLIVALGGFLIIPLICSLLYREPDRLTFALAIPLTLASGGLLMLLFRNYRHQTMRQRESFFFVTISWVMATVFGAIPYLIYGALPDFASAFFEAMSGFTTTGASAFTEVESLPHGLLLWRSSTNWLGGAGIVALFGVLIQRGIGGGGEISAFKAEYSGGALSERISPRIRDNIIAICLAYLGLTLLVIFLYLLCGMTLFDAVNQCFAVVATGGFSTKNTSIAGFNSGSVEWVTTLGMYLSGINLTLYCMMFKKHRRKSILQNDELKYYTLIFMLFSLAIAINLYINSTYPDENFLYSLRQSSFQVCSLMTTTGFVSANYDLWPDFSRILLFIVMFFGGCSGSTASSIKVSRWVIITRIAIAEMKTMFHPQIFRRIFYNGKLLTQNRIHNVMLLFFLFIATYLAGVILLAFSGLDFVSAFSASIATLGNVGPAIGTLGPVGNYSSVSVFGKWVLSFLMLAGRLEIINMLVLLIPGIWKR